MGEPKRFIPERTLSGGTLVGNSYTSEFAQCPFSWFNSYLRVHPDAPTKAAGITPRFRSPFLMAGSTVHIGLATWYASGVQGGEDTGARDIDAAIEAAKVCHNSQVHLYESSEQAEADWEMCSVLLRTYHDYFGPNGQSPEWPELQVVCDGEGKPLVEREFQIPLGYRDYVFTSRPDLICTVRGLLRTRDHKTSHPRFVGERREWTHWDPQFTGEALCLHTLFPEEPIQGTEANILVKNWTPKSKWKPAEHEMATHGSLDLLAFRLEVVDILGQIDRRVAQFKTLTEEEGHDPESAANLLFPRHGTRTQACTAFRGCQYQSLCQHKEHVASSLNHYRPRQVEERNENQRRPY